MHISREEEGDLPPITPEADACQGGTSFLAAGVSLLLSPFAAVSQHPPVIFPSWCFVGLLAISSLAHALWCSARYGTHRDSRRLLGVAILLSLLALGVPFTSYFSSFHDYPWGVGIPLAVALLVGGWRSHQRWIAFALPLFLACWFFGAAQPPKITSLPASLTVDDLTVTIQSLERKPSVLFCEFQLKGKPGEEAEHHDLHGINLEGNIAPAISVRCWSPHQWPTDLQDSPDGPAINEAQFSAYTFPPNWARSFDLTITVPAWPPEPATSVTLAVPQPGVPPRSKPWTSEGGGIHLSAGNLQWTTSRSRSPAVRCLALQISYSGYSYSGGNGQELRATDDAGRVIPVRSWSIQGSQDGATLEAELWPIDEGTKHIRLDAYSEAQRARRLKVFRFRGIPNQTINLREGTR